MKANPKKTNKGDKKLITSHMIGDTRVKDLGSKRGLRHKGYKITIIICSREDDAENKWSRVEEHHDI